MLLKKNSKTVTVHQQDTKLCAILQLVSAPLKPLNTLDLSPERAGCLG